MRYSPKNTNGADNPMLPEVVDRATRRAGIDRLRVEEKARAGDGLAAERHRLPMVEVDQRGALIGTNRPVPSIDVFDGRSRLIAYFLMWHTDKPAAEQCEGCTFNTARTNELPYPNPRDISRATLSQGPYEEGSRYRDFMGWSFPRYSGPRTRTPASRSATSRTVTRSTKPTGPAAAATK